MFAKSKDVIFANETVVLYLTLDGKRSCVQKWEAITVVGLYLHSVQNPDLCPFYPGIRTMLAAIKVVIREDTFQEG